jgi:hypothetical protein
MVGGAPLLVPAVGQDLAGQLALEQAQPGVEQSGVRQDGAGEDERLGVLEDVVAADVVLDRAPEVATLAPQLVGHARGQRRVPVQRRDRRRPGDDAQ